MVDENPYTIVADKARETFLEIRRLRKTVSQFTKSQKDGMKRKEKELQNQWWENVKAYMMKGENDPPFKNLSLFKGQKGGS